AGDLPLPPRRVDPATITVSASSELAADHDAGLTYAARNTIDGDLATAWNDGVGGVGVGETLTYTFAQPVRLVRVDAVNGYAKSPRRYVENARVRRATLSTDATSFPVTFADRYRLWQSFSLDAAPTSSLTVEIESVYAGSTYRDVALTEFAFWAQQA
ncbi:MAG: hypothetical protein M3276_08640, partial [Actinomycetota bacterium]|nr:hypothetical protein [Actinomycetota bacterium]